MNTGIDFCLSISKLHLPSKCESFFINIYISEASFYLETAVSSLQQRFYRNDLRTHNLATLLQQFIVKATLVLGNIKMGQEM